ncbi:MAG TPA: hypothetical protein VIA18_28935 [Polyangia bacterium]|nr:hypothetical protein [Polyangia bacterium]
MIRPGMTVRTNDGRKVGTLVAIGRDELEIESGIIFKERFFAPVDCIVEVTDHEIICKPIELPERDREIPDMWFGTAETEDELQNKIDDRHLDDVLANHSPDHR